MNELLWQFSYLQVLDFLTTLAFLLSGVQEANPVVRLVVAASPSAWVGLVTVKTVALLLGLCCWRMGRLRLLTRINLFFAVLVAWNLVAIIVGMAGRQA
jgi:hypothetical protein